MIPKRGRGLVPLLVVLAVLTWLPLAIERFPPITDLPEHEAAIRVIADLVRGDPVAKATWELDLLRSQYLLYHVAGALLALATGSAAVANRLLLLVAAVGYPLATARLLGALGRDPRLAVFACMPFFGRALTVGFLPFCASIPLALYALAIFVEQCRDPSRGRAALLAALGILLFYTHVNAYMVTVLVTVAWSAILRFPRGEQRRFARGALTVARDLCVWIPSALCAVHWSMEGSLDGPTGLFGENVGRIGLWRSVKALPLWIHDPWPARFDDAAGFMWWVAILLVVFTNLDALRKGAVREVLVLYAPLAVGVALVLALPFHVGAAGMLNVRLATFVALAVLVPLPEPQGAWGTGALALAGAATVVLGVGSAVHVRATRQAEIGDFGALVDRVAPGQRLELLHFQPASTETYYPPWMRVAAYHVALHGGVAEWTFAHLSHWSVHVRKGASGPERPAFWDINPCLFRNAQDGEWADWVLVEGNADPFADAPPGPRFERSARSGRFVLYRKTEGTWPGDASLDPGPCARM